MIENQQPIWANVCVKLLQGPLYRTNANDKNWNTLTAYESKIQEYFYTIGLHVVIEKSDGYAFLSQLADEDSNDSLPHLIKKIPLTPEISLLCVLLREALDSFDSSQSDSSVLVLSENEIKDMLSVFLKEKTDQTKFYSKLDGYLMQLVNLSFLRELNKDDTFVKSNTAILEREFEVRRIIRAKIDTEF